MELNNRTQNCAECEFMKIYDYSNKIYYCDHPERQALSGVRGEIR